MGHCGTIDQKWKDNRVRDPILGDRSIGVTKALHSELCNRGYAYIFQMMAISESK